MKKIFISSTFVDLEEERKESISVIDGIEGAKAIAMEKFTADPSPSKDVCLKHLDKCDAVILIIGFRYGYIDHEEKISMTEIEYNRAKELNLPVFVFLKEIETDGEYDFEDDKLLKSFKIKVEVERYRKKFKDLNDLGKKILLSIHNYEVENGEIGAQNKIFQSGSEFFNPDLNADHYFNHLYLFVGRIDTLEEINCFVNSNRQVLIISGMAGSGKSRLLFEFDSQFSKNGNFELKFLSKDASLSNSDSLRQLSVSKNNIIVVDDAYRRGDLSPLFEVVRQNPKNFKLILTCRPYEVDIIKAQLILNFDPINFKEPLKIKNLTYEDVEKLGLSILQ